MHHIACKCICEEKGLTYCPRTSVGLTSWSRMRHCAPRTCSRSWSPSSTWIRGGRWGGGCRCRRRHRRRGKATTAIMVTMVVSAPQSWHAYASGCRSSGGYSSRLGSDLRPGRGGGGGGDVPPLAGLAVAALARGSLGKTAARGLLDEHAWVKADGATKVHGWKRPMQGGEEDGTMTTAK